MTKINSYLISTDGIDLSKILKNWTWLVGEDKAVIALTKMGDALLNDKENRLFHLDTGMGELELKCNDYSDFLQVKLESEEYELILLPGLVDDLEDKGIVLGEQQVYSFTKIPLLGGAYDKENIFPVDLYEHFSLSGEVHFQLKDLSAGTEVKIEVTE